MSFKAVFERAEAMKSLREPIVDRDPGDEADAPAWVWVDHFMCFHSSKNERDACKGRRTYSRPPIDHSGRGR